MSGLIIGKPVYVETTQVCPGCEREFPVRSLLAHTRECERYRLRQAEQTADYEDEDGQWWGFDHEAGEWKKIRQPSR